MRQGRVWGIYAILALALTGCEALRAQSPAATEPEPSDNAGQPAAAASSEATPNSGTEAAGQPATVTKPAPAANAAPAGATSGGDATPQTAAAGSTANSAASTSAPAADSQAAAKDDSSGTLVHHLAADISVALPVAWQEFDIGSMPPPTAIANYAPPFHLTGILALQNPKQVAMLQFATSSNPLIGHDSNWLDSQMHMPSGSGMSVLDLIFYYFFPPTSTCIEQVLTQDPKASFAPLPAGASGRDSSSGPVLQVSLGCKPPATLAGFFQSQVSGGITFAQTNDGPRAFADIAKFYLGPMERVAIGGMVWFVFEAQRTDPLGPNAGTNFNLSGNLQGAQSDYFWAIGAISPFPWVNDSPRGNQPLIHVAYASVGVNGNKHADFMALLQKVQVKGANTGQ
jgi:hypothetical protein